jgi:hypothetical protein
MSTAVAPTRPWYLTLIGVLGVIQGVITVIAGIALAVENDDRDLLRHTDVSSDAILATGIAAVILGAITILVAIGLLRGSNVARLVLGVLELLHLGGGIYVLLAHDGVQRWDGLWVIILSLLILWIIFGSERSQAFFESRGAR